MLNLANPFDNDKKLCTAKIQLLLRRKHYRILPMDVYVGRDLESFEDHLALVPPQLQNEDELELENWFCVLPSQVEIGTRNSDSVSGDSSEFILQNSPAD